MFIHTKTRSFVWTHTNGPTVNQIPRSRLQIDIAKMANGIKAIFACVVWQEAPSYWYDILSKSVSSAVRLSLWKKHTLIPTVGETFTYVLWYTEADAYCLGYKIIIQSDVRTSEQLESWLCVLWSGGSQEFSCAWFYRVMLLSFQVSAFNIEPEFRYRRLSIWRQKPQVYWRLSIIIRKKILWYLFFEDYLCQVLAAPTFQRVHPFNPIYDDGKGGSGISSGCSLSQR